MIKGEEKFNEIRQVLRNAQLTLEDFIGEWLSRSDNANPDFEKMGKTRKNIKYIRETLDK